MTVTKDGLIEEIRINDEFAQILLSEYPETKKEGSEPIIRRKQIFTRDYLEYLKSNQTGNKLLPPNCRYFEPVNTGAIAVIEEPPAFRTIKLAFNLKEEFVRLATNGKLEEYNIKQDDYHEYQNTFTLAFPYVIFILYIDNYNR